MVCLAYKKLKEYVESGKPTKRTMSRVPQFVELMASAPADGFSECDIELEGRHGKIRIHWKGMTASDLTELSRMILEQA